MAEVKVTKKEYFEEIKAIVEGAEVENKEDLIAFIDKQLETLANRAEKAKERAAKNKAAGDELRAAVYAVITDEFQTADEITAQVEGEEITKAKIVARLTQLVNAESIVKEVVKTDDGRKLTAYKLA
jgi:hypothetical protein